ncbi:MAG: NAD(+)/NADH kinase [Gemmatimonadales bacterium]
MNVGVVGNVRHPGLSEVLARLASLAPSHGLSLVAENSLEDVWPAPVPALDLSGGTQLDLLVTFGGDGTLLRGARLLGESQVPIMGVNLGRVGFLTTTAPETLEHAIDEFAAGHYVLEPRRVLGSTIFTREGSERAGELALNDVVVHKAGVARVIRVCVHVGDDEIGQYSTDGIIVATPTGSTAYSLSAGGPIVKPTVDALVITAICPHTLAVRPLVVPGYESVTVEPIPPHIDEVLVSFDGQVGTILEPGDRIVVRCVDWELQLVRLSGDGFFERVRAKLQWGDLTDRENLVADR